MRVWAYTISDASGIGKDDVQKTLLDTSWSEDEARNEILHTHERWAIGTRFTGSGYFKTFLVDKDSP